jgi:hypothetical protein
MVGIQDTGCVSDYGSGGKKDSRTAIKTKKNQNLIDADSAPIHDQRIKNNNHCK